MTDLQVMAAILTAFAGMVGALGTWTVKSFGAAAKVQASIIADLRGENLMLREELREERRRLYPPPSATP